MLITLKRRIRQGVFLMAATVLLTGCELFEFSPNDVRAPAADRDLTAKNLARLQATPKPTGGDTLRFVFTGDSQRFYDEAGSLVESVNRQRGIAAVVVAGDISDFGLRREMQWVNDRLRHLNVPYLTVIGNHDQVANGRQAYQEIFGPLNYTFTYDRTRFILIDTNSREYGFNGKVPDIGWLEQQLADTVGVRRQILLCHVPPTNEDFDPTLIKPYTEALAKAPRLLFHLNGHAHSFSIGEPYADGVTYINSYAFEKRQYVILTVWGADQYKLEKVAF
ncbi:metallophosphoesterase family protein [Hymenobacter sp. HDW8]|uniref:metallophosphoesterase family protein n=1 Tax=Hymenobacter sp. HDW8 TaxID=2714932 RepID=UPI001F0DD1CD|nr:metallophosphoesterase [Hymenobacter sp. HDW8]